MTKEDLDTLKKIFILIGFRTEDCTEEAKKLLKATIQKNDPSCISGVKTWFFTKTKAVTTVPKNTDYCRVRYLAEEDRILHITFFILKHNKEVIQIVPGEEVLVHANFVLERTAGKIYDKDYTKYIAKLLNKAKGVEREAWYSKETGFTDNEPTSLPRVEIIYDPYFNAEKIEITFNDYSSVLSNSVVQEFNTLIQGESYLKNYPEAKEFLDTKIQLSILGGQ